jgi:hypothetical protein
MHVLQIWERLLSTERPLQGLYNYVRCSSTDNDRLIAVIYFIYSIYISGIAHCMICVSGEDPAISRELK